MSPDSEHIPWFARLTTRISLLVLSVALISTVVVGITSAYWTQRSLTRHVSAEFDRILTSVADDVDHWYTSLALAVETGAASSQLRGILPERRIDESVNWTADGRKKLDRWLESEFRKLSHPAALFLVNEEGTVIEWVGEKVPIANISELAYLYGRRSHISSGFLVDQTIYQIIAEPVPEAVNRAGSRYTLCVLFTPAYLDQVIETEQVRAASRLYMLDSGLEIIAPQVNRRVVRQFSGSLPKETDDSVSMRRYTNAKGDLMVGSLIRIPVLNGSLAIERSYSAVFDPVWVTIITTAVTSLVMMLILGLIAWNVSRGIMQPLDTLSAAVSRMKKGDLKTELDVSYRNDEIGLLTRNFNGMREELYQVKRELRKEARLDRLTGLYNRRYLDEQFPIIEKTVFRSGAELSVLMIDLDNFKGWNDKFGHDVGDTVLKIVAKTLKRTTRDSDLVVRMGGDEFVIIASGTDLVGAATLAQKIAQSLPFDLDSEREVLGVTKEHQLSMKVRDITVSIGVAEFEGDRHALFKNADAALYRAKNAGRNQFRVHGSVKTGTNVTAHPSARSSG